MGNDILVGLPIAIGLSFWILIFYGIYLIVKENKNAKNLPVGAKGKKYFGLKFWLITIFFFPISLVYVVIKIMQYQNEQNRKTEGSNKFQELYYKELYEKQKRENERELKKELQEENNE